MHVVEQLTFNVPYIYCDIDTNSSVLSAYLPEAHYTTRVVSPRLKPARAMREAQFYYCLTRESQVCRTNINLD